MKREIKPTDLSFNRSMKNDYFDAQICKMGLTDLRDSLCVLIVLIKAFIVLHVFKRFPFSIRDQGRILVYLS